MHSDVVETYIDRGSWRDEAQVRALFAGQIPHGDALFDELNPFPSITGWFIAARAVEVWVVRASQRIVAAGWYEVMPDSARVVVVTHSTWVDTADGLLEQIERALRTPASDGRVLTYRAVAWLPESPLTQPMEKVYVQRGWIAKPQYYARTDGASLKRSEPERWLEIARSSGIDVRPIGLPELQGLRVRRAVESEYLELQPYLAVRAQTPLAVNSIKYTALRGRVAWSAPDWLGDAGDQPDSLLVKRALLSRMHLEAGELPDVLVSSEPLDEVIAWFTPNLRQTTVRRCELPIVPVRR